MMLTYDRRGLTTEAREVASHLLDLLRARFRPTLETSTDMIILCMRAAATYQKLPGRCKKAAVTHAIVTFVDEENMTGVLEPVVLHVLPKLIDRLVEIDNQELVINPKVKSTAGKLSGACVSLADKLPCLRKKKTPRELVLSRTNSWNTRSSTEFRKGKSPTK